MKLLLLGDEAIALSAIHSGISGVYAYPGTPSTEITEYIQNRQKADPASERIFCKWCTNEKTAMEAALGMSYMGKRALVCMKHVGMNVAADAFVNSAMTGANGGLVVVAADDPSMHSSQNEQDSRFYGKFAMIPVFEPSSQQEAYDMVRDAFEFSEQNRIPVLLRITTRMAHSRAEVETREDVLAQKPISYPENPRQWVLLPANSKVRNEQLIKDQVDFENDAEPGYRNLRYSIQLPHGELPRRSSLRSAQDIPLPYSSPVGQDHGGRGNQPCNSHGRGSASCRGDDKRHDQLGHTGGRPS